MSTDGPLLVFGPRSLDYDFGEHHPLTPRRFGPGIDLLRAVGATPALEPAPATDDELALVHSVRYVDTVRRHGDDPWMPATMGIGLSDNPAFEGMHEAAAAVAGGSLRAMEAILRGDVRHAHHPGGGLHHAMPERASGFCIYDDPAVAIARARADGLRVMYIDLDVHHGDGVQAMFLRDDGVLTLSFHESGRYLFPGTGFLDELGLGSAAGTSVNLPFEPYSGESVWLPAVRTLVGELGASFAPDVVVSQHGADAHAWDPLAHLRVTTTAQAEAARIVDAMAHRWADGRWLATGGGGYDVYRVVPRVWALTWLAGAHREPPLTIPRDWRERWARDADRYGQGPPPERFLDEPNAGADVSATQADAERRSTATAALVRRVVVPRLVREAVDRGWWAPASAWPAAVDGSNPFRSSPPATSSGEADAVEIVGSVDRAMLDRLTLIPRVVPPADPADVRTIVEAALTEAGTSVSAAVAGTTVVGLAISARRVDATEGAVDADAASLLALGVAPAWRRLGIGERLLRAHLAGVVGTVEALVTVAERDPVEPEDAGVRSAVARTLLERAGCTAVGPPPDIATADRWAVAAIRDR